MIKKIPHIANRALINLCLEQSNDKRLQKVEGSASRQMEIRAIANRVIEYALHPGTSYGVIEVVFAEQPWGGLNELYLQCPTLVTFKNFAPEKDDIDQNTLLVKHVIVVSNWSNNLKIFNATIENEPVHLMLYTAVTKPKI